MKRSYKTQEKIAGELKALALSLRAEGEGFFPSERELCAKTGASRETVRRVLEGLETEGLLIKGSKGRAVSVASKSGPKAFFVTSGVSSIGNMTWSRVWQALEKLASERGLDVSLRLIEADKEDELFSSLMKEGPDVLIAAEFSARLKSAFLATPGRPFAIAVDQSDAEAFDCAACLDNFEAGRLAARRLLDSGYRKLCCFSEKQSPAYLPFEKRVEGFLSALKDAALPCEGATKRIDRTKGQVSFFRNLLSASDEIAAGPFDALFLCTDEFVRFPLEIVSERKSVPREFGFATIAGGGDALSRKPLICSLNQAEGKIAESLVRILERLRDSKPVKPLKAFLKPEVANEGETLRR